MKFQYIMVLDRLDPAEAVLRHFDPDGEPKSRATVEMERTDWETVDGGRRYLVTIEPLEEVSG
jgi:hypothetical protein